MSITQIMPKITIFGKTIPRILYDDTDTPTTKIMGYYILLLIIANIVLVMGMYQACVSKIV